MVFLDHPLAFVVGWVQAFPLLGESNRENIWESTLFVGGGTNDETYVRACITAPFKDVVHNCAVLVPFCASPGGGGAHRSQPRVVVGAIHGRRRHAPHHHLLEKRPGMDSPTPPLRTFHYLLSTPAGLIPLSCSSPRSHSFLASGRIRFLFLVTQSFVCINTTLTHLSYHHPC